MKFKLLASIVSVSLVLIPNVALAEWVHIASSEGVEFYIDDSSIEPQGNMVYLWQQEVMEKPYKGVVKSFITQFGVDCNNRTRTTIQAAAYNNAGKIINNNSLVNPPGTVKNIIPGTTGDAVWSAVCN